MAWFHGSPDVRDITARGGFEPRTEMRRVIIDPARHAALLCARPSGEAADVASLQDFADRLAAETEMRPYRVPVFLSDRRAVAASYADDRRAFDYQAAVPATLTVEVETDAAKALRIDAAGDSFRGIRLAAVRAAIGHSMPGSADAFERALTHHETRGRGPDRISTADLSVLMQDLDVDIVDVANVCDSHDAGPMLSTVRMVFDPTRLSIASADLDRLRALLLDDPPSP